MMRFFFFGLRLSALLLALPVPLLAGWIGVTITELADDSEKPGTVRVERVVSDGPAAKAGIRPGDHLVGFAGRQVIGCGELVSAVRAAEAGNRVEVKVLREGREITVPVVLADQPMGTGEPWVTVIRPPKILIPEKHQSLHRRGYLGISVIPLSKGLGDYFATEQGVLISEVVPDSPAERAGLRAGDVIRRIGTADIRDAAQVQEEIRKRKEGEAVAITVVRNRRERTLEAILEEKEAEAFIFAPSAGGEWLQDFDLDASRQALEAYRKATEHYLEEGGQGAAELAEKLSQAEKALELYYKDPALRRLLEDRSADLKRLLEQTEARSLAEDQALKAKELALRGADARLQAKTQEMQEKLLQEMNQRLKEMEARLKEKEERLRRLEAELEERQKDR